MPASTVGRPTTSLSVGRADQDDESLVADVRDVAKSAPVAAYVNFLVGEAVRAQASDIHLEATRSGLLVRFRLDGILLAGTRGAGRNSKPRFSST